MNLHHFADVASFLFADLSDQTHTQPPSRTSMIHGFTSTTAGALLFDNVFVFLNPFFFRLLASDLYCRIKYIAKVHETNRPLNLFQFERDGIVCSQWAITDKVRLLDALKAEHFFIQFLPNPTGRIGRLFYETNLRHKIYQIPAIEEKNRSSERDSSFVVSTSSPQGRQILSQIPSDDFPFQVVVPSDIDGEYGHESGIAKFAFFVRANIVTTQIVI